MARREHGRARPRVVEAAGERLVGGNRRRPRGSHRLGYTAIESWLENRAVLDATVGWGLLVVMAASVVLRETATVRGVEVVRQARH